MEFTVKVENRLTVVPNLTPDGIVPNTKSPVFSGLSPDIQLSLFSYRT